MDLGSRIRARRKEKGLSQEALARRADMSLNGFTDIERGVATNPHYNTLMKIARALGTTPGGLIAEPVDPKKAQAAASRASKAAADAKRQARELGRGSIEAQYRDLTTRALEERRAGNGTQAQLSAHKALLLQREVADNANQLENARSGLLSHTAIPADSPEVEELHVWAQELKELVDRMTGIVEELGGVALSEEESAVLRDQAKGETA